MSKYTLSNQLNEIYNQNSLINEEETQDNVDLIEQLMLDIPRLNHEQKDAYDQIINRVNNKCVGNNAMFIDGPAGTGKTFLYKSVLNKIR